MGRQRTRKGDPIVEDFEKLRSLRWTDQAKIAQELEFLLQDPTVARVGRYPRDRLKRVDSLGRLLDRMLSRIERRERASPPAFDRSYAWAGAVLLRRVRDGPTHGNLSEADVGQLYEAIEDRWKVTRGERKGQPLRPGTFRQHHQATTYAVLAAEFRDLLDSVLVRRVASRVGTEYDAPGSPLSARVAGSRRVRIVDVLTQPGLLISFPWRREGSQQDEAADLLDTLVREVKNNEHYLILSGPGFGKSLLTHALQFRLTQSEGLTAVRADLRDLRQSFGSVDPDTTQALSQYGGRSIAAEKPIVLLDALDEYMAGRPYEHVINELDRTFLYTASLITCRTHFFRQFVSMSRLVEHSNIVWLSPWSDTEVTEYITGYVRFLATRSTADASAAHVSQATQLALRFFNRDDIKRVCTTPLRVTMALEILDPLDALRTDHAAAPPEMNTMLEFYEEFVNRVLDRESSRPGNTLTADQKARLLEEVAWGFYDDTLGDIHDPASLTPAALESRLRQMVLPSSLDAVQGDLEDRSVLDRVGRGRPMHDSISFGHKTIQDYFVATRLFRMLEADVDEAARMFLRLGSPAVSEFYKEHIALTRATSRSGLARLSASCLQALSSLEALTPETREEEGRRRLATGQLLYNLGVTSEHSGIAYLRTRLGTESDPWLRREIILGLAFSGDVSELEAYVQALRDERSQGGTATLNEQNLGFHFSFFGDQPLDPGAPERDHGLNRCEQTVASLMYQLSRPVTSATWMIDLYTLIDLWLNVEWARETVETCAHEHIESLRDSLGVLSTSDLSRDWPEVEHLRLLVGRVRTGSSD